MDGLFNDVRKSSFIRDGFYSLQINLKNFERVAIDNNPFDETVSDIERRSLQDKVLCRSTVSKRVKPVNNTFLSLAKDLSTAIAEGVMRY